MGEYVIRGGERGYERLQILARAWGPTTGDLLDRVDLGPGLRCLDVGCGGGDVTFEIARRTGPTGRVIGIDMDEVKLALGREEAARRSLADVELRVADVDDWREDDAYDLVYCRFVLEHLSQPLDLLRRMWAAVRLGGALVVEDADFDGLFCDPSNDGFDFWKRSYCGVLEHRGGDPQIGRKLHRYFRDVGTPNPTVSVVQRADAEGEAKTLSLSTLEATADAILAEGLAGEAELADAIASLAAFTSDPGTVTGSPRVFQAWARRSA